MKILGWLIILFGIYATMASNSGYTLLVVACGVLMVIPIGDSTRTRIFGWAAVVGGAFVTAFLGWTGIVAAVCGVAILYVQSRTRDAGNDNTRTEMAD